jgi:flagellar biosynthesis protein FlhG
MKDLLDSSGSWTVDQADGLRRLFARTGCTIVPLVSNPHVKASGVAVERITAALAMQGRKTLVVDAGETSPPPSEASALELAPCIERLSQHIAYLAARGLPRRYVDTHGSAARLLDELTRLVPDAQVLLLHASAPDLARLCTARALRPVVLASDHPESVKHAYAGIKLLAQRAGWMSFDLLMLAPDRSLRAEAICKTLADCADQFIGASLRDWAWIDPLTPAREVPSASLQAMVQAHFELDGAGSPISWQAAQGAAATSDHRN